MLHHPDPEIDSRCFVYLKEDMAKAVSEQRLRRLRLTSKTARLHKDERLYLEWLRAGYRPEKKHVHWMIFASNEYGKTQLYVAQKRLWLLGWDPINMKDPLYHWSRTGPWSAMRLFEAALEKGDNFRTGYTPDNLGDRIEQARLAVLRGFEQLDMCFKQDLVCHEYLSRGPYKPIDLDDSTGN